MRPCLYLVMLLSLAGCKKKDAPAEAVEIYLLDNYERVAGQCRIDVATAEIESAPLIRNEDILEYEQKHHNIRLTADAYQRAQVLQDGQGFALTVDKQVIYYGIYKPSISSSSCAESVTMDALIPGNGYIAIRLGYPTGTVGTFYDDPRTRPLLFSALQAQGKLRR